MKTVRDVIVDIERKLKADPRPACFQCLGIVSQELSDHVAKYIQDSLNKSYSVEEGICPRKDHRARVVRIKA